MLSSVGSDTSRDSRWVTARTGSVLGPDLDATALLTALRRPGFDDTEIQVDGAQWSWPRSLEGYAPGEDVVVFARFAETLGDGLSLDSDLQWPMASLDDKPGSAGIDDLS